MVRLAPPPSGRTSSGSPARTSAPTSAATATPTPSRPNLDRLATQGVRYTNAFAPIGVCAPSRSTPHHRHVPPVGRHAAHALPGHAAGGREVLTRSTSATPATTARTTSRPTTTSPHPTGDLGRVSSKAPTGGTGPKGQPFFAVFNFTTTHESQIRTRPSGSTGTRPTLTAARAARPGQGRRSRRTTPTRRRCRQDWARYDDLITAMDKQVGDVPEAARRGRAGRRHDRLLLLRPRRRHAAGKRWLYDSGTRVPLIVRFPEKWRHLAPGRAGHGRPTGWSASSISGRRC